MKTERIIPIDFQNDESEFVTLVIVPSPDKDLPNRLKNGNFLPRERVLLAKIARTVSTAMCHFPWYAIPTESMKIDDIKEVTVNER